MLVSPSDFRVHVRPGWRLRCFSHEGTHSMAVALLHESTFDAALSSGDRAVESDVRPRDRRSEVRLSAEDASWLRGARLKYGPEVRVIDVSAGGILVESDGLALEPRANIVFELSGPKGTILVPRAFSAVTRSRDRSRDIRRRASSSVRCRSRRLPRWPRIRRQQVHRRRPRPHRCRRVPRGSASSRGFETETWCADSPTTFIRRSRTCT